MENVRRQVKSHGLDNIHLPGFRRGEQLWRKLRHAHALLFPIRNTLLNLCRCPSKTYSYAQARRPIITNRVGEVAAVLQEKAIYVDQNNGAFAAAIKQAIKEPQYDVEYDIAGHNWSRRTDVLLDTLDATTNSRVR